METDPGYPLLNYCHVQYELCLRLIKDDTGLVTGNEHSVLTLSTQIRDREVVNCLMDLVGFRSWEGGREGQ